MQERIRNAARDADPGLPALRTCAGLLPRWWRASLVVPGPALRRYGYYPKDVK